MPQIKPEKTIMVEHGWDIPWRGPVCGFVFTGEKAPKGCPVCHSPSHEFVREEDRVQLTYDGKKFDVLLINGSTHRGGNTGYMADLAEEVLHEGGVSYCRYNLNEHLIDYCWCCNGVRGGVLLLPVQEQK